MLLFKTSAETLKNVLSHKKHALVSEPKSWEPNEILLISKNKNDCSRNEKQIQYIMNLESIKKTSKDEIEKYWQDSKNDWNYLVSCSAVSLLNTPFNLSDVIGARASFYGPSQRPQKILIQDENLIMKYLKGTSSI